MNKVQCIISVISVIVGTFLIIAGYSFFDKVSILIACGLGLILGQQINVIVTLTKGNKDE